MRNLKRALSLALASVMVLGLMIVGSNALTVDFGDADQIDPQYTEAIDVLSTIGLFDGMNDDANSFEPVGTLTRAQAAKLLTVMRLGVDTAEGLDKNTQIFQDVPKGHWAAGFIAYCNSVGILAGNGDGTFDPEGKLTGVQFGKMLLVALGYDADIEGYVNSGSTWEINVATDMIEAGIDVEDISFSDPITREQAAQMVFNTIITPMVKYSSNDSREYLTTTIAAENTISDYELTSSDVNHNGGYTVEFGEKYFTKLVRDYDVDVFGRPCYIWSYDSDKIGEYIDDDIMIASYTTSVTYQDLYNLLGSNVLKNNQLTVYIDGVSNPNTSVTYNGDSYYAGIFETSDISRSDKNVAGRTDNGTLTQVFLNKSEKTITISIINTYLAKANADYNTRQDLVSLEVYGVKRTGKDFIKVSGSNGTSQSQNAYGEDYDLAISAKEGGFFCVTVANGEIQSMDIPEVVSDIALNSFKRSSSVTSGNDTYYYSATTTYKTDVLDKYSDNNMKDTTYKLFIDEYGYLIGIEINKKADNYVFIAGYESFSSVLTTAKTDAFAIFADGSTATITVKEAASTESGLHKWDNDDDPLTPDAPVWKPDGEANENSWYKYTKDSNGIYSLTPVDPNGVGTTKSLVQFQDTSSTEINRSHVWLVDNDNVLTNGNNAYGNEDTVYISVKLGKANDVELINGVRSVTKGARNTSLKLASTGIEPDGAYVLAKDGYIIAAVAVAKNAGVSSNYVYITSGEESQEDYADNEWTWYRKGIVDGHEVTLKERGDKVTWIGRESEVANSTDMLPYHWYLVSYDSDNYVVESKEITWKTDGNNLVAFALGTSYSDLVSDNGSDDTEYDAIKDFNQLNSLPSNRDEVILCGERVSRIVNNGSGNDLSVKQYTLYLDKLDSNSGIHFEPGANAVVISKINDKVDVEYFTGAQNNVDVAVKSLESTTFNGIVFAVMGNDEAVASSIIIVYEDALGSVGPQGPSSSGDFARVKIDTNTKNIQALDRNGALNPNVNGSYSYTLYKRSDNQDTYDEVQNGELTFRSGQTNELASVLKPGASYYIIVDGIESGKVYIQNPPPAGGADA